MKYRLTAQTWGFAILATSLAASQALADPAEMAKRLPPGANSIAYINVDGIFSSKLGQAEKWSEQLADAYATRPLVIPPDAKQVMMAAWIEPTTTDPMWEVSLIQVSKTIAMDRIARAEGGYTDSLGGKMAAWSPTNAYFVRLDKNMLGVVCPADRQFAVRWMSRESSGDNVLSPFLGSALKQITPETGYLFALDLQDVVSEKRVRNRLAMDEFECLAEKKIDAFKFSEAIASVMGLTLTVNVKDVIVGQCVIDFGRPVAEVVPFAKPLLLEVLDKAGAKLDDFNDWKFTSRDKSIIASGKLSTDGLRRLCSLIDPPSPAGSDDAAPEAKSVTEKSANSAAAAAASKRYYQAVSKIVDSFGSRVRSATSLTASATYLARDARTMARLPILNVDPDLIQWGSTVSQQLLNIAATAGVGGLQAQSRTANILDSTSRDGSGSYWITDSDADPLDAVDRRNVSRQRRAATLEEKTKAVQQASQVIMDLEASRTAIRTAMTKKYNIEF